MNTGLLKYACLAAIVILAAGCRKVRYEPDPSDVPSGAPLVTVLYGPDALGDRSYNDLIYAGVERTAHARGIRTMQLAPSTPSEGLAILQAFFDQMRVQRDTVRRLLIVAGAEYEAYLRQNSHKLEGNPLCDLLFLETREPLQGKGSTICLPYYGAMYEAGAVSSVFSVLGSVLLVLANPEDTAMKESLRGFSDGFNANYTSSDEDRELLVKWISEDPSGGFKIGDGDAMRMVYDDGQRPLASLVIPVCGGASGTFYRLFDLFGGCDYMGIDAPTLSPHCPFSAVKHIDRAMDLCIGQWLSAGGMPKHQDLSFADGWTEMVLHPYTDMQKYFSESVLTPQFLETIHEDALKKEAEYE